MIVRNENGKLATCISQLQHSRMTGELAHVWGNGRFGIPGPAGLLSFASGIHDIGWTEWEQNPRINPETGHPYDFLSMPKHDHIAIWESGFRHSLGFGLFPALLVLRHNGLLAGKQPCIGDDPELDRFLSFSNGKIGEITAHLQSDPAFEPFSTDENIERLSSILLLLDYISLIMCMGKERPNPFGPPPTISGTEFHMEADQTNPETFRLDPWPFGLKSFTWICEVIHHQKNEKWSLASRKVSFIEMHLKAY